ncbi:antitoxin Xre/MbcA/ParS toxin-binding domain-containing protein [Gloeobacter violaceus]|uniref:Gll1213 protein n=1 Tax=Gloeobacter violaceus (strain ATCC 29082 / PCC 7421) TaxID=251221 RepID=Q7NLB3_GLOVI|nr:antitoxin Xre/MbcA/ParS toxin-binding domain-containing protein [Gloeobacter violaceus]BAC89154.1 gll1213 [Gloeobacter violaceus PCC 7421]
MSNAVGRSRPVSGNAAEPGAGSLQQAVAVDNYRAIKVLSIQFSLSRKQVKEIFGISERTQYRYERENPMLKPSVGDRLKRFRRILTQAVDLFEDEGEAERWLASSKVDLEGLAPLDLLGTDEGSKRVEQMLYRAEYGIFG